MGGPLTGTIASRKDKHMDKNVDAIASQDGTSPTTDVTVTESEWKENEVSNRGTMGKSHTTQLPESYSIIRVILNYPSHTTQLPSEGSSGNAMISGTKYNSVKVYATLK